MAWVLFADAENALGAAIEAHPSASFAGSSASFSNVDIDNGGALFHIRYSLLEAGNTTRVRVVLSGSSSDAYSFVGDEARVYYTEPGGSNVVRYVFPTGVVDFTEDFEFELNTPDYDNIGELMMTFVAETPLTGFNGVLTFYLWEEGGAGGASCFWTDLVNAEQVCSDVVPPGEGIAFCGFEDDGGGFGNGAYRVRFAVGGDRYVGMYSDALYTAIQTASAVTITGLAAADITSVDPGAPPLPGSTPLPEVTYDSVSIALSDADLAFGYWLADSGEAGTGWHWARVDVDGDLYYGALYEGGGV